MSLPKEPKEKYSRRAGEKLFLKGERSHTPKAAVVRKPYRPGQHGKRRRRDSEYGRQLLEKQKLRWTYRLSEKQFRRYFQQAEQAKGTVGEALINRLESRLDNAVYRLGFAESRDAARQLVSHRHIMRNDESVNIPSMEVSVGDTITIKESSKKKGMFENLHGRLKKYTPPSWLELDKDNLIGTVIDTPTADSDNLPADIQMVIEYYSR